MDAFTEIITNATGSLLLALLINTGLCGVLCIQVCTYYTAFPADPIAVKVLIYTVLLIESVQTLMMSVDGYGALVTQKGDILGLDDIRSFWFSVPVLGVIVVAIGQLFYAYRLRILSKSWIFPVTIATSSACTVASTLLTAVRVYDAGKISAAFGNSFAPILASFLGNILCDIEIAIAMIYYLSRHRPIPGSRLHHQVKRLIRIIIEAGCLTTFTTIIAFLLYIIYKGFFYFLIPYAMIPKLYSNTLLFIMNNRVKIAGGRHNAESDIDIVFSRGAGMVSYGGAYTNSEGNITFRAASRGNLDSEMPEGQAYPMSYLG